MSKKIQFEEGAAIYSKPIRGVYRMPFSGMWSVSGKEPAHYEKDDTVVLFESDILSVVLVEKDFSQKLSWWNRIKRWFR